MNLEAVEQEVLRYLKQVSNPLVSVDGLFDRLVRKEEFQGIGREDLLTFLKHHELFRIMEPLGLAAEPDAAKVLEEAGLATGPHVILDTRVPTPVQLSEMMEQQLQVLQEALASALKEAREEEDETRARVLLDALKRADGLRRRLGGLQEARNDR